MFELKRLSESIPKALEKALRYRLLDEPAEAESICKGFGSFRNRVHPSSGPSEQLGYHVPPDLEAKDQGARL